MIFSGTGNAAGGVPVLERLPSGDLIISGRNGELRPEKHPAPRRFGFDRPAGRRFGQPPRMMLHGTSAATGTWHVALIRIGFERDRKDELSSLDLSLGEGGFNLQPDSTWVIDPPPHDRAYFNAHMTCLRNYYRAQSCGKIDITWEIFPSGSGECYKLSDPADYGPGNGMWSVDQLVTFVHDAMIAADPQVNYNDFDAVVIAHAGPNLQSDVNNDTPNDIPSLFARLGDEDRFVTDDGKIITDCSVIPETGIQDGYYSGIIPVLAHEFGHQLGLPDLYNTVSGGTGIGIWGNMGSGGQLGADLPDGEGGWKRVDGVIPAGMSAWSRYYLGWASADTVDSFTGGIELAAVVRPPAELVRIDISNDEYFLVENRCTEVDRYLTGIVVDDETGVFLGVGNCTNCSGGIPDQLEFEMSPEYDYLLPTEGGRTGTDAGPGILIWHIDERLIASRWELNELNSREPFAVRLMEAGGVLDIGDPTSGLSYGYYNDAFYDENSSRFSDLTMPSAWSNLGVPSGVEVEDISGRDTVMTFSAGRRSVIAAESFYADTLSREGCIIPAGDQPGALAVDGEGKGWLNAVRLPVFELGSAPVLPPAFAPGFTPAADAVIIGDRTGKIHALSTESWDEAPGNWPVSTSGLSCFPVAIETGTGIAVAAADNSGRISVYDSAGEEDYYLELEPGDLNAANIAAVVDTTGLTDQLIFLSAGEGRSALRWWNFVQEDHVSVELPFSASVLERSAVIAAGDIIPDTPGAEVYLTLQRQGKVYLCSQDGVLFSREPGGYLQPPAVVDINGDSSLDIVVTNGRQIYAISASGANLTGWPREVGKFHNFSLREKITAPVSAVGSAGGARVIGITGNGILLNLDYRGEHLGGDYPERIGGSMVCPPVFTGIDGEGAMAYIDVLQNRTGEYYESRPERISIRWRRGLFSPGEISTSWFGVGGDLMRRSFARGAGRWNAPAARWADMEENLVIYPNPVEGGRAGFQFRAPSGARASLMVFDISGEIVLERDKVCGGGEEHEIAVSMEGTGSGVYVARLTVTSGGNSYRALKKFAVVN